jgi:hypothetical protein
MNDVQLENYYSSDILPRFTSVELGDIAWKGHGKVGPDACAHYFDDAAGREYVLLYEDYPAGEPFIDGLSHEPVPYEADNAIEGALYIQPVNGNGQVDNLTGYFTLYREILR